jgi:two-component system response regulator PilR (NtrC family)
MLCSRLLAYQARALLEARSTDPERAVQLLVEAESYLIGRQLRDLEVLVGRLRARAGTGRRGRAAPSPAHGPAEESSPVARSGCGDGQMAGNSPAMLEVLSSIRRLGPSRLPVLITGETGTGKDLVARAIHGESTRRFSPLISINCAALPEQLLEAELFGYRRGAFSGAEEDRDGLLQKAHGGTFFFDEIGELPSSLQGKILRVLDSSTLRPVGAESEIRIDTRFLFASNQDLRALVKEKRFRQDLFFRLAVLEIRVPPLRERIEDLPLLIQHFQGLSGTGKAPLLFEESALGLLTAYTWPGNVRELRNVILRLSLDRKEMVTAGDVKILLREQPPGGLFPPTVLRSRHLDQLFAELEREYLVLLHEDKGGDLKAMADCLGVTERALYKRFKLLGITPGRLRKR